MGKQLDQRYETLPSFMERLRSSGVRLFINEGQPSRIGFAGHLAEADLNLLTVRQAELASFLKARDAKNFNNVPRTYDEAGPSVGQETLWRWVNRRQNPLWNETISLVRRYEHISCAQAEMAIRQLVEFHRTLRSSFHMEGDELKIVLNDVGSLQIEVVKLARGGRRCHGANVLRAFKNAGVQLNSKWLMRALLIDLDSEIVVGLLFNHIIFDGLSRQLAQSHLDLLINDPINAKTAMEKRDFLDFACWERLWFEGASGELLLNHWQNWLNQRSPVKSPSGNTLFWMPGGVKAYSWSVSEWQFERLNVTTARLLTSLPQLLLTVFGIAIAGWTNFDSFPIRCIGDARTRRDLAKVVGYMTCVDVVDFTWGPGQSLADTVHQVAVEWQSSYRLRLPGCAFDFPKHPTSNNSQAPEFTAGISFTFNFDRTTRHTSVPTRKGLCASDWFKWPPQLNQSNAGASGVLVRPLYLRIAERVDGLEFEMSFNESLFSSNDQATVLHRFLSELGSLIQ